MLRKKICTMLAAVMIVTTVLGNNVQVAKAATIDGQAIATVAQKVENGT